jgi:hypothetical protein
LLQYIITAGVLQVLGKFHCLSEQPWTIKEQEEQELKIHLKIAYLHKNKMYRYGTVPRHKKGLHAKRLFYSKVATVKVIVN